jgi:hypothetical protein
MSIINDALKKAAREKQLFPNKSGQILSEVKSMNKAEHKTLIKRLFIWTGVGLTALLVAILVVNYFTGFEEVATNSTIDQSVFHLKSIDIETAQEISNFHLTGIVYDKQKPYAIINQHIVGEGTLVNGAKLLEIHPDFVKLSIDGKEHKLTIK